MSPNRRRFLALSGAALLAGCTGSDTDDDSTDTDGDARGGTATPTSRNTATTDSEAGNGGPALAEDLATALGAVPRSIKDTRFTSLFVSDPDALTEVPGLGAASEQTLVGSVDRQYGLTASAVDRTVTAVSPDSARTVTVLVGSFAAAEVDVALDATAVHAADGFAVLAQDDGRPWEAGVRAAREAAADPTAGSVDALGGLLAPVQDSTSVVVATDPSDTDTFGVDDDVAALAIARDRLDATRERKAYAVTFAEAGAVDTETVTAVLRRTETAVDVSDVDVDYRRYDRTVVGSFTAAVPPARQPDDSPAIRFRVSSDDAGDTVTVVARGEESVDPANLEFRVDGEPRTPPWGDRRAPIEPGERFTATVGPLRLVTVVWLDPNREGVEQPLGRSVIATGGFEGEYDPGTDTYVVTYTGDRTVGADRLELSVRPFGAPGQSRERPLSAVVGEQLAPGDEVRIEDVRPGDGISLLLSVGDAGSAYAQNVFGTAVSPPGEFSFEVGDGETTLVYTGPARPAADYRVTVDGEPADTQFADEYDRLTDGDRITVTTTVGDRVRVEWTARERPLPVAGESVSPDAAFDAAFDPATGELTVTYTDGEPIAAERLLLALPRNDSATRYSWDRTGTVEPGDSTTATLEGEPPEVVYVLLGESTVLDRVRLADGESDG